MWRSLFVASFIAGKGFAWEREFHVLILVNDLFASELKFNTIVSFRNKI